MEVGQPGTGAPAGAVAAVQAALRARRAARLHRGVRAGGRCGRGSRRTIRDWYGLRLPPERIAVTTGASGAFPLAFLAAFDPGDRVALTAPFYPPYVNILTALGMRPVVLPTRAGDALPADGRDAGAARSAARRADRRQPVQSRRHHAAPRRTGGHRALVRRRGACGWSRDEIYHGLHYARPIATGGRVQPHADRGQQLLQVFLHDRLADRLAGAAGGPACARSSAWRRTCSSRAPHISQVAAEAAFDCHDELAANVGALCALAGAADRRRCRRRAFRRLSPAEGAFYLYADVGDRTE